MTDTAATKRCRWFVFSGAWRCDTHGGVRKGPQLVLAEPCCKSPDCPKPLTDDEFTDAREIVYDESNNQSLAEIQRVLRYVPRLFAMIESKDEALAAVLRVCDYAEGNVEFTPVLIEKVRCAAGDHHNHGKCPLETLRGDDALAALQEKPACITVTSVQEATEAILRVDWGPAKIFPSEAVEKARTYAEAALGVERRY